MTHRDCGVQRSSGAVGVILWGGVHVASRSSGVVHQRHAAIGVETHRIAGLDEQALKIEMTTQNEIDVLVYLMNIHSH